MSRITHLLNTTLTFQRKGVTAAGSGRFPEVFANVPALTDLPARQPFAASAAERKIAAQDKMVVTHTSYVDGQPDIRLNDEFTFATLRYRVTGVMRPSVDDHTKLMLEEIRPKVT